MGDPLTIIGAGLTIGGGLFSFFGKQKEADAYRRQADIYDQQKEIWDRQAEQIRLMAEDQAKFHEYNARNSLFQSKLFKIVAGQNRTMGQIDEQGIEYEVMRKIHKAKIMGSRLMGKQFAGYAKANVDPSSGSSLVVLNETNREIENDIAALIEQRTATVDEQWVLESYDVCSATGKIPEVTLRLKHGGEEKCTTVVGGDGPIDAVFLALEKATGVSVVCKDFSVHSVTVGKDAQGEVMVQVEHQGRLYRGRGV